MIKRLFFLVILGLSLGYLYALPKDSLVAKINPIDSLNSTSTSQIKFTRSDFTLLDSLRKDSILRSIAFPYENLQSAEGLDEIKFESRTLPGVKEIEFRKKRDENWKFWILMAIIFFVASVRLMNLKRFDEIISSAFEMSFDLKVWKDKSPNYLLTSLAIFLGFIASGALFSVTYAERKSLIEVNSDISLFWTVSLGMIIVYLAKIILNLFIGFIFKTQQLSQLFLFNAISISNLVGLFLIVLNLLYIYVPDTLIVRFIGACAIIIILVGFIFRMVKNLLMGVNVSKYPTIYLFTYLCAFEILPWCVVFKLYLNTWFN
ncbi:MAG: DUF4271 domain-containing protein [Bacteroidia bacterium]